MIGLTRIANPDFICFLALWCLLHLREQLFCL